MHEISDLPSPPPVPPPVGLPHFMLLFSAPLAKGPMNALAYTRTGRVLLHALCLIRHPAKLRWHWQGIRREFAT